MRRPSLLAAAALVVVAGLAAVAVALARDGSEGAGTDAGGESGPAVRPPASSTHPAPGWLPEGMDAAAPDVLDDVPARRPAARATLARGPGPDDVLVVVEVDGTRMDEADVVADALGAHMGAQQMPDGSYSIASIVGVDTTRAVVVRDGAAVSDQLVQTAADPTVAIADALPVGWQESGIDIGWVPRVGTTHLAFYQRHDGEELRSMVGLGTVAATLPPAEELEMLLVGEERTTVRGHDAWSYPVAIGGSAGTALVWQEAPGVVGYAEGLGLDAATVARVAESGTWPSGAEAPAAEEPAGAGWADASSVGALCDARPEGTAPPPAEEAGEATTGYVDTGAGDVNYELVLWQGRTVDRGREVTADCWRLRLVQRDRGPEVRGGGPFPGDASLPVEALTPVLASDTDVVFVAAAAAGTTFTATGNEMHTYEVDAVTADGVGFTFLRVMRGDQDEVTFTAHGLDGTTADYGPYPLDGSAGPPIPGT